MYSSDVSILQNHIHHLCPANGRTVGSQGHQEVQQYLIDQMHALGLKPYKGEDYRLLYTHKGISFCNLAGVIPGKDPTLPPLLIGAHYDSFLEAPSADDNASAISVHLLLASRWIHKEFPSDILVVFFDAEEPPYYRSQAMGSEVFVQKQLDSRGVSLAIISDLIGHGEICREFRSVPGFDSVLKNPLLAEPFREFLFITGAGTHAQLPSILSKLESQSLRPLCLRENRLGCFSDERAFFDAHHPCLFFSNGRGTHYHQITDVPQWLDYDKMIRIANYIDTLVNACMNKGQDFFQPEGHYDRYSDNQFTEFEVANMRKAFKDSILEYLIEDQPNAEQFLMSFYRKFPFVYS